jgi:hypothetical protein
MDFTLYFIGGIDGGSKHMILSMNSSLLSLAFYFELSVKNFQPKRPYFKLLACVSSHTIRKMSKLKRCLYIDVVRVRSLSRARNLATNLELVENHPQISIKILSATFESMADVL